MELKDVVKNILEKAYALLPAKMNTKAATAMLLAIGLQESKFLHRQQVITVTRDGKKVNVPEGPAVSFWQFEAGGGVKGVMQYYSTREHCKALCEHFGVAFDQKAIWEAMKTNDVLGACMARLLLFTDPLALPLPIPAQEDTAWRLYSRVWRPGKPHPAGWPGNWAAAIKEVAE